MAWYHVGACDCPIGCCDCGEPAPPISTEEENKKFHERNKHIWYAYNPKYSLDRIVTTESRNRPGYYHQSWKFRYLGKLDPRL